MVETIGKQLLRARQARGLSLEEAALETRIRPSQLAALEADDYSSFGNNTYARGFLQIYGKFLRVDVGAVTRELESANPISVGDYQYLNAVTEEQPPPREQSRARTRSAGRRESERRRPSLAPLIVFIVLLAIAGLGTHFYIQAKRLDTSIQTTEPTAAAVGEDGVPEATPSPITAASGTTGVPGPVPSSTAAPGNTTTDRTFLGGSPTPTPAGAPAPPAGALQSPQATPAPLPAVNELIVEPLRKTWVRIRRDDPAAEPIWDDVLYPKVGLLRLKGNKFWVEAREPEALALRKNGQSIAVPPPGEPIQ
jgi:cytoskeletal protein RodZ